jgi:hypothetical protein
MGTPPRNSSEKLAGARRSASRVRAEWLMLVNDETVTPADLLNEAARADARPLLRLSLRQVLLAQPAWGRKRTEAVIGHISSIFGGRIEGRQITVGWLLDPRAGGRRFHAWLDAHQPKTRPPWPGFPYVRSSSDV